MRIAIILSFVVSFVALVTGFVILTLAGKDTAGFIGFAAGAGAMLVPQLFNLLKTHDIGQDVAQVKERTNGPLDTLNAKVDALIEQNGESKNARGS